MAKEKEKLKHEKYKNYPNVIPCALETTGAIGPIFKQTLQLLADAIATRSNIPYPIIMNRIRSSIIAKLMMHNAEMIISSIPL